MHSELVSSGSKRRISSAHWPSIDLPPTTFHFDRMDVVNFRVVGEKEREKFFLKEMEGESRGVDFSFMQSFSLIQLVQLVTGSLGSCSDTRLVPLVANADANADAGLLFFFLKTCTSVK